MKNWIIFSLLLFVIGSGSQAQNLPKCIEKMNKKDNLTTTKFERVLQFSGNRTVYEFSVKSIPNCIHCPRGLVYYDANCNMVAYFMNSRGPTGFVADGYTLAEFGKSGAQRVTYGIKREDISNQIDKVIAKNDSLNKAGVKQIVQVKMRDQILYSFEHKLNPKLPNCKDCPITIVFYNAKYQPEVTFQVGGLAGITANNGYKATDYTSRQKLWILWNAN